MNYLVFTIVYNIYESEANAHWHNRPEERMLYCRDSGNKERGYSDLLYAAPIMSLLVKAKSFSVRITRLINLQKLPSKCSAITGLLPA